MKAEFRTESDFLGAIEVPAQALYAAQTAQAVARFPVSSLRFSRP
jgi:fumarate hydratase class II